MQKINSAMAAIVMSLALMTLAMMLTQDNVDAKIKIAETEILTEIIGRQITALKK